MSTAGVNTTRQAVRAGMAAYFGGALVTSDRSWQQGPLLGYGLGAVKAYVGKGVPDSDYTVGMAAGRGMGAVGVLQLATSHRWRDGFGGGTAQNVATGWKEEHFGVVLHLFHIAEQPHVEDAEADLEALIEATIRLIEADRTLGQTVLQAGEGPQGIDSAMGVPEITQRGRATTEATVSFTVVTFTQA